MTVPALLGRYLRGRLQRAGHRLLQALEQGARQPGAGLAVARLGEVQATEVAEFADRDVAVENLLQEQVGGNHRTEVAVAPAVADRARQTADQFLGDGIGQLALSNQNRNVRSSPDRNVLLDPFKEEPCLSTEQPPTGFL